MQELIDALAMRVPFVVWQPDVDWQRGAASTWATPEQPTVSRADLEYRSGDGRNIQIVSASELDIRQTAFWMVARFRNFRGNWVERYQEMVPPLKDSRWEESTLFCGGEPVAARTLKAEDITIATATFNGTVIVVGSQRCDIPTLSVAPLGVILQGVCPNLALPESPEDRC